MDDKSSRKNITVAHVALGTPCTVNGGFYALTELTKETLKFCPDVGPEIYNRNITKCFRGTGLEIEFREGLKCPTEFEYMTVAMEKWFCYMNVALELMQHMTKNNQDIAKVTKMLSWFYCIINDYSDILSAVASGGKNLGEGLVEGNFTFPVIHAIKTKGNQEVYGKIKQKSLFQKILNFVNSPRHDLPAKKRHRLKVRADRDLGKRRKL